MPRSTSKFDTKVLIVFALVFTFSLCLLSIGKVSVAKTAFSTTSDITSVSLMAPSNLYSNDTNWAGYIVSSDFQNPQATVTYVSASWTVPTVKISTNDTFSAVWIGIGGFFDETLIQTGTEQDSINGQGEYSAWIELLPQTAMTIDTVAVSPGDEINVSIQLVNANTDQWSILIGDLTKDQSYTHSFFYPSSKLSAEWIVERPEISSRRSRGSLTSLADVGTVDFSNCQTTLGGETGVISSFPTVQSIMYETVQSQTNAGSMQLAAVSVLTDSGSSFTVETSPSVIPELPLLMLIPFFIGAGLLVIAMAQQRSFKSNSAVA